MARNPLAKPSEDGEQPAATPRRTNVLYMAGGVASIGVAALAYAGMVPGGETAAAMAVTASAVTVLGGLAREIVTSDAAPFDPAQAAHLERMATIEAEAEAKMAWHNLTGQAFRALQDVVAERKQNV